MGTEALRVQVPEDSPGPVPGPTPSLTLVSTRTQTEPKERTIVDWARFAGASLRRHREAGPELWVGQPFPSASARAGEYVKG